MRYALLLSALFLFGTACSTIEEDVCGAKCDCEGCNDVAYDVCLSENDADYREADFRGCLDYYDEWLDCQDATGVCSGADWKTACGPEHDRLKSCTKP